MALKKVGVQLTAEDASQFNADLDRANRAVSDFGRDAEKAGGGVSRFGEIATGALRQVGVIAVEVGLQAARAIAGFVTDSIGVAATYEASLNRFASVAGDAVADAGMAISDFSDLALEMGAKTQYSAGEAADAMVELAKGGLDPATIAAGGLEGALSLAAAGELELSEAANITAKQLGVWSDTGVTAANVADRLAQAANASTVDVDELAVGMANVGGVAKIAGLSFDETTQTLALLAPGFSSAADASTSMKTFLTRLIPTTKSATGAMIALGLATKDGESKFYDSTGAFIGMEAAAQLLHEQTKDLTEAQRLQAFQTIFGADAIRAAAMIAEAGAVGFDAMGASMTAAGTATEQAAKRNQGFAFAMESLKGSIETVQIVLGTMLLPILTDLVTNYVTPAINGVLAFAQAFGESGDKVGFLIAQVNEVIPGFTAFLETAQLVAGFVQDNLTAILSSLAAMLIAVVVPAFTAWAAAAYASATATIAALAPVVLPIVAIGAAVALLVTAWNNDWGGMQTKLRAFWEDTGRPIFDTVRVWVEEKLVAAMAVLRRAWEVAWPIIQTAVQTVYLFFHNTVWPWLQNTAFPWLQNTALPALKVVFETVWAAIKVAVDTVYTFLRDTVWPWLQNTAWPWLKDVALPAMQTAFKTTWDAIKTAVNVTWTFLRDDVFPALTIAMTAIGTAVDTLKTAWSTAWSGIQSAASTARGVIDGVISGITSAIATAVSAINGLITLINRIPGVNIPTIPGGRVAPPASSGQQSRSAMITNMSTVNNNWSPTYNNANRSPEQDYYLQRVLAR